MRLLLGIVIVAMLAAVSWYAWQPVEAPGARSVRNQLGGGDTAGYAQVLGPRAMSFPADHGPHPHYRQEWWYYTGNLSAADGRHFGYQLTFFRIALAPDAREGDSAWSANQAYMAHFALTDVAGKHFYRAERFSRNALGLAGAQAAPFKVWLEDWSVSSDAPGSLPMRLHAAAEGVELDLELNSLKPVVLQGDRGYSRKGQAEGNASYYYSLTRMPSLGSLRLGDETLSVSGTSWMDREWSTSALEEGQLGWDWFALQLDDGRDIMFYRLRRRDGSVDPYSSGVIIEPDGRKQVLPLNAVEFEVLGHWRSPTSGTVYPSRWRINIPSEDLQLNIEPHLADQEMAFAFRYWEGAVKLTGSSKGKEIGGNGYAELVGYGDER